MLAGLHHCIEMQQQARFGTGIRAALPTLVHSPVIDDCIYAGMKSQCDRIGGHLIRETA